MSERSDAELVAGARAGDAAAFGTLVRRYQSAVYRLAYGMVGDWATAQDLTQDAFIRAYQKLDTIEDPARFGGWLRRIAFRLGLSHLAAARRDLRDLQDVEDLPELLAEPDAVEALEAREVGTALLEAIRELPARYRVPLALQHVEGLSQERIAGFLGVPIGTIKSLVSRARRLLRVELEPLIEGDIPVVDDVFRSNPLPDDFAEVLTTAIETARRGDLAQLEALLQANPHLLRARHGPHERSLLHVASEGGSLPIVELLLERGADPRQRDKGDNAYALHFAAERGHLEVVKLLVEAGADVNATDDVHELGPIGWATCFAETQREVARYLLGKGARHHVFSAVSMGDADPVRAIAASDPGALGRRLSDHDVRRTPLHQAVVKGQYAMIDLLVELGADVQARDLHGLGPLERAFRRQDAEAVARLTALGARLQPASESPTGLRQTTPILTVADVTASLDYYAETLGFHVDWRWGEPTSFSCISRDGLEIFVGAGEPAPPGARLVILVNDVDALHDELAGRGARIVAAPASTPWGLREMRVEDLDRNVIRFGS